MIPAVFINCNQIPFVDLILSHDKLNETRNRNTLGRFIDERILLVETGNGKPIVKGSAVIESIHQVFIRSLWQPHRIHGCIPEGSTYDWNDTTKKKVIYILSDVQPCDPFPLPADCRRHGRVWAEYTGSI